MHCNKINKSLLFSLLILFVSLVDLLVGAPLFMDRGSDGNLREVGQVGKRSIHCM